MAQLIPQLSALEVDVYIKFLSDAFGFQVRRYWRDPNDSAHVNVEVEFEGVVIGIGQRRGDRRAPKDPSAPNIGLYVVVNDVDAHYSRARAANAVITSEPADQRWGHRMYGAVDPEGHDWGFATPLREAP
jgi:uncharacterized glyoxalase superfamily protein PhnB